jgi:hypothetical protein
MTKRIAQLAGLTLLLGIVFVPSLHASPHFSFSLRVGPSGPIAPYAVAPGPRSGYVWQPGYYVQTEFGERWVEGAWIPAPYVRGTYDRGTYDRRYDRGNYDRANYERGNYDRGNYDRGNYDRNWDGHRDRDGRDGDRNERGNWRR